MHKEFTQINKKTATTQQKHKQKSRTGSAKEETYEEHVYEDMSTSSVIQENEKYVILHLSY